MHVRANFDPEQVKRPTTTVAGKKAEQPHAQGFRRSLE
jgi:hypothetical protein